MKLSFLLIPVFFLFIHGSAQASYMLLPMDGEQTNHLKAYGIAYWVLEKEVESWWLLNYRGGSFAFQHNSAFEKECKTRGVSYEVISASQFRAIREEIAHPEVNQEAIKLEVAPQIAVYTPDVNARGESIQPWDDAVTLVLTYAEIPYETIYDREVIGDKLAQYDWLHLHHEDFTGQYGKFYRAYGGTAWYRSHQKRQESLAAELGFEKVSELKLAVVDKIQEYIIGGGFMFAMCSATDTYDIALAARNVDIAAQMFDGDPAHPDPDPLLNYEECLAFQNFKLEKNPMVYEYSTLDNTAQRNVDAKQDYFSLFDFSAKWDPVPTMLTQNHTRTVKGFMGQTTAFKKKYIKPEVIVLGDNKAVDEVRYIHGTRGEGTWTFYAGHDPEDYQHRVGDPETDLNLHPKSAGYRLILNNILFPAAKKKERKT